MNKKYLNPEDNKEHLINLIEWCCITVLQESGDGEGMWYSQYYNIKDLYMFIEKYKLLPEHWKMLINEEDITIGDDQEYFIITNDKEVFNNRPSWQQFCLEY